MADPSSSGNLCASWPMPMFRPRSALRRAPQRSLLHKSNPMFQSFDEIADFSQSAARVARLRDGLRADGLDGFIVPRADEHQGEYIPPSAARLEWLTGFSGSAGVAVVLADSAAILIDGRYTLQVRQQVDLAVFEPVASAETSLADVPEEGSGRQAHRLRSLAAHGGRGETPAHGAGIGRRRTRGAGRQSDRPDLERPSGAAERPRRRPCGELCRQTGGRQARRTGEGDRRSQGRCDDPDRPVVDRLGLQHSRRGRARTRR